MPELPDAPRAPRRPTVLRHGNDVRVDDWYWLRDRDNPAVTEHLRAENAYTDAVLAPLAATREQLFGEIRSRVVETDVSAPVRRGDFEYFTRTVAEHQYRWHCRRPVGAVAPLRAGDEPGGGAGEVVLLDENALAAPGEFFALRGLAVSPSQRLLAYAVDRSGGELKLVVCDIHGVASPRWSDRYRLCVGLGSGTTGCAFGAIAVKTSGCREE